MSFQGTLKSNSISDNKTGKQDGRSAKRPQLCDAKWTAEKIAEPMELVGWLRRR